MKKYICVMLFPLTILFAACGGESAVLKVGFDEMVSAVSAASDNENAMMEAGANYIKGSMKIDVEEYEACVVMVNAFGANIDEFGIFKTANAAKAKELAEVLTAYFKFRDDIWMPEYMPHEYPKLQNAEYMIKGEYVIYAVMSEDNKAAAFSAFEDCFR